MYAVIESGGKQYRVSEGDRIQVDRLPGRAGDEVLIDRVVLLGGEQVRVGTPLVEGARVRARLLSHDQADKVIIFKYRPRKRYRRRRGFRASLTTLEITSIEA